jgi:hypothetical protein
MYIEAVTTFLSENENKSEARQFVMKPGMSRGLFWVHQTEVIVV